MTALPVPRPEDVYDAETVAGFRAAGYWRDVGSPGTELEFAL